MRALVLLLAALSAPASAMTLKSIDLTDGGPIGGAQVHVRCGGQNVSPGLAWSAAPPGTKSFVITMIDHDVAPVGWVHWVATDLPANTRALARGAGLPAGAKGVISNMGSNEYAGPCPRHAPAVHHYQITVWAMPTATTVIPPNGRADALESQLRKSALASAAITGAVKQIH